MGPYIQPQIITDAQCLESVSMAYTTGICLGLLLGLAIILMIIPFMGATIKALRIGGRWLWLKRKRVFTASALVVIFLYTEKAEAQWFFPCGGAICQAEELPVKDRKTREETAITALKTAAMLIDMLRQAVLGHVNISHQTDVFLEQQASARYGEALTYGSDSSEVWPEQFTFDDPYPNGDYLEADLEQRRRVLDTQRTMQLLSERRNHEFEVDREEINHLAEEMRDADGRNEIAKKQGLVGIAAIQQQQKTDQLLVTLINQGAVDYSDRVNQEVKRESQEREFANNFGREVPFPEFHELGL